MTGQVGALRRWDARVRAVVIVVVRLLVSVALAGLANFVLDESIARGRGTHLWDDQYDRPLDLFLLGAGILWLLVLLIQALVGNLAVTVAIVAVLTGLVGEANYQKMLLRGEPFYPSDIRFAGDVGFLGDMVGRDVLVGAALVLLGLVAVCATVFWVGHRFLPRLDRVHDRRMWQLMLAGRVTVVLVCAVLLGYVTQFNSPGNDARRLYDRSGAFWSEWNQPVNYSLNGFVGGFLYNTPVQAMTRPPGYSRAAMERLVRKYAAVAARTNRDRDAHALDDVNVVLVLNEAFTDPQQLKGFTTVKDPIPFTRQLMQRTTSGEMLAQGLGGGTANMEFELLTGMSMHEFAPQLTTAYQSLVPHYSRFPSAVGLFEELGHDTVAVHPYKRGMYRRDEVYRILGFDEFVYDEEMEFTDKLDNSVVISDDSSFRQVRREIDNHDRPLLVNLVTMQNHMPYNGIYDDPVRVKGLQRGGRSLGQYLRGLSHTDEALRSFITGLQQSKEKTIVLMYGDHLPSAYPQSVRELNGVRGTHETPFFVWSNFASHKERLPTTSPWQFMNLVLAEAGATIPAYYALLDELHKEVPAMDGETVVDGRDRTVEMKDLSPRAQSLLRDYRMVQYDLSVGDRYAADTMFYPLTRDTPVAGR